MSALWPAEFIYTPLPFSSELHPALFWSLLAAETIEEQIHPLIENQRVHPFLEVRKLTDPHHRLQGQRGLFAKDHIVQDSDLGTYAGEMKLLNPCFSIAKGNWTYALIGWLGPYYLLINAEKYANEMAFMNDYRGICKEPNVAMRTVVHRGVYFPMFYALKEISAGDELLWDYGDAYWLLSRT